MRFFYKAQDSQIKKIITDIFHSGDYMITVHYQKTKGKFQNRRLTNIINSLKKGYQEKGKGLIFVGAADTKAAKLIVNADIAPLELIELLWNLKDYTLISITETTSQKGICLAAEELLQNTKKYITVSGITDKIIRIWQKAPAEQRRVQHGNTT